MPWLILNISPTSDERAIKRAYAARLKQTRPEDDPSGFATLREAFEFALHLARQWREQEALAQPGQEAVSATTESPIEAIPRRAAQTHSGDSAMEAPLRQAGNEPATATLLRADPPIHTVYWRDRQAALDGQIEDLRRAAFDAAIDDAQLSRLAAQYGWLNMVEPPKALPHEWLRRVRRRLHERMVTDLVFRLAEHAQNNPQLAIRHFLEAVETPDWEALDLRSLLESALAQWLATLEAAPPTLLQAVADWACWRDASGYARLGISPAAVRFASASTLKTFGKPGSNMHASLRMPRPSSVIGFSMPCCCQARAGGGAGAH